MEIWRELQRQLDERGLKVKKGVIQDATFITSDPGHAKADTPRGGVWGRRRAGAGMAHGQRKASGHISGINSTRSLTQISD